MSRRLAFLGLVLVVLGSHGASARADEEPTTANPLFKLNDGELSLYHTEPPQPLRPAGERFLRDLDARDPRVAAAARDAIRYQLQAEEAQKFAHTKRFVLAAYGILWAVVASFAAVMYLRQRRLAETIADLEAKIHKNSERAA